MTPLKAIRAKCIDCCCGSKYEPAKCTATKCPLYPFREGHNPNRKGATARKSQPIVEVGLFDEEGEE